MNLLTPRAWTGSVCVCLRVCQCAVCLLMYVILKLFLCVCVCVALGLGDKGGGDVFIPRGPLPLTPQGAGH